MAPKRKNIEDQALNRALRVIGDVAAPDLDLPAEYGALVDSYRKLLRKFHKTLVISDTYDAQRQEFSRKLEEATFKYRQLKEVALPICMYCKKIRSDDQYWQQLDTFFLNNADIMFSHGICPACVKNAYEKMGMTRKRSALANAGPGRAPFAQTAQKPAEDDALKEMRALVRQCAFEGNPLAPEVEQFVEKYGKMLRRFNKIVSISDNYQSQLMELNSRLELMARTDLLTGLANRWEMVARLEAEKNRSERHGKTFSIILADIDHFKIVNDTYGHQAGDRVLRAIADKLRNTLRGEDICSRWGGEEFLIILPETDLPQAGAVADKLLDKVRHTTIQWNGQGINVTMSMGVGGLIPGISIDELVRMADDALYRAKSAGRDRVVAMEEKPDSD